MFIFHARRITTRSAATLCLNMLEARAIPTQECTRSVKWKDVIITSNFPYFSSLFSITWHAALLRRSAKICCHSGLHTVWVLIYISRLLEKYTRSAVMVFFHICDFRWSNLRILLFQTSVFSLKASLHWFSQFEGVLVSPTMI